MLYIYIYMYYIYIYIYIHTSERGLARGLEDDGGRGSDSAALWEEVQYTVSFQNFKFVFAA